MNKVNQHILSQCKPASEGLKNNCKIEIINNSEELNKFFDEYAKSKIDWIFRGEGMYSYPLKTSLERVIERLDKDMKEAFDFKTCSEESFEKCFEKSLIKEFKRKCHLFIKNPPEEDRFIEWIALMQHYGAPTRFLDCTYSFFIAVYFALDKLKNDDEYCCVWAIDSNWLGENFISCLNKNEIKKLYWDLAKREKIFKKNIFDQSNKQVYVINPSRLNDRLVIQQGVFLCPGDPSKTFVENLEGNLSQSDFEDKIIRYCISYKLRDETFKKLNRMNINAASLFPGLDGFAKSLAILPKFLL